MSLLLVTGAAGMFVGAQGWPGGVELATMLLGLALACGGASALNHVIDRDIDRLMGDRTASRPVASGRFPAARALEFGLVPGSGRGVVERGVLDGHDAVQIARAGEGVHTGERGHDVDGLGSVGRSTSGRRT